MSCGCAIKEKPYELHDLNESVLRTMLHEAQLEVDRALQAQREWAAALRRKTKARNEAKRKRRKMRENPLSRRAEKSKNGYSKPHKA